jgi:hypothetical protein
VVRTRAWVFAGAGLLLLAWVGAAHADAARTLKPLHPVHATNGIECEVCHEAATTSTTGRDALRPQEETCAQCHDVKDTAQCGTCHVGPAAPTGYPPRVVVAQNFPHATHVNQGMNCASCHGATATSEPVLPDKATCRDCHATASQQTDCRICHAPEENLVPASHGPQFLELHALQASWNQGRCSVCHTETDCQECHNGDNVRPRSHPVNYFFDHALDARSKEISCSTCHRSDFCSDCHAAQRVLPTNHSQSTWLLPDGGRHADEGRFDIESCAACHTAGTSAPTCARCHGR